MSILNNSPYGQTTTDDYGLTLPKTQATVTQPPKAKTLQDIMNEQNALATQQKTSLFETAGVNNTMPAFRGMSTFKPDFAGLKSSFDQITSSYDDYKGAIGDQAGIQRSELSMQLDRLMGTIDESRTRNRQELTGARSMISEDAFVRERNLQAQMSSRGLGGSGLEAMNMVQEKMATGKNVSEVMNSYYDAEKEMVKQVEQSQQNYQIAVQKVDSSLQAALAQITNTQAATRMDYEKTVMDLQRQVVESVNAANAARASYDMTVAQFNQNQAKLRMEIEAYSNEMYGSFNETDIRNVLTSGRGEKDILAALKDMKIPEAMGREMIAAEKAGVTTQLQQQIDNTKALGGKTEDLRAMVLAWSQQGMDISGLSLDGGKTTINGQNLQGTVTKMADWTSTNPTYKTETPTYRGMSGLK